MPSQKTVNTQAMLAAGESGAAAVQRAAELQSQEADASRRQTMQTAEMVGNSMQRESEFSRAQAQQESQFARQMGQDDKRLAEQQRSNRMGEAINQDAQDIEMADKGLESKGSSRADRLRQDMERGGQQTLGAQADPEQQAGDERYRSQADQPLEVAGPDRRTIAPTEERRATEQSKLTTNRMNAQANYMNAVRNYQEAKLKGAGGDPEAIKREMQSLQQPIKSAAKLFDAGKDSELTDSQWDDIAAMSEGNPDAGLQQEIASRKFGPSLGRFLQNRVSQSAIQFMAVTGEMPDGNLVDMASPAMRQFTENANLMQGYLRNADGGGLLSESLDIHSLASRNNMVRKLTAQAMMRQMANPTLGGGDSSLIPSQGGQSAIPAPGQRPGAPVNLTPGRNPLPPGAPDPNQREDSPVQRALRDREQRTIDEQSRSDANRRDAEQRDRELRASKGRPRYSDTRGAGL